MKQNTKILVNNAFVVLIRAFLAGICISLGAILFLKTSNKTVGALFFSLGLLLICTFGYNIYTGKICYLFNNLTWSNKTEIPYWLMLIVTLIGNYLGAIFASGCFRLMGSIPDIVSEMIADKLALEWYQVLFNSIFCGILVLFAVEGFKRKNVLILILSISGFIIADYEHCIANMFFFSIGGSYSGESLMFLMITIIGNSIGGMFVPLCHKMIRRLEGKNE